MIITNCTEQHPYRSCSFDITVHIVERSRDENLGIHAFSAQRKYRMESKVAWMSRPLTIVRFMIATVGRKGQASYDSRLVTLDPTDSGIHPRYDHDGAVWLTIKIRRAKCLNIHLLRHSSATRWWRRSLDDPCIVAWCSCCRCLKTEAVHARKARDR